MAECSVEDCGNEAKRDGLCWTHIKRRQRKKVVQTPPREYRQEPFKLALEKAFDFSDLAATDQKGWKRAIERFRWALREYSDARMEREVERLLRSVERVKTQLEQLLEAHPKRRKERTG